MRLPSVLPLFFLLLCISLASAAQISSCGNAVGNSVLVNDLVFAGGMCLSYQNGNQSTMVLDCAGHSITGNGSGIAIRQADNAGNLNSLTIKNCVIKNVAMGISSNANYTVLQMGIRNTTMQGITNTAIWGGTPSIIYTLQNVSITANSNAKIIFSYTSTYYIINSSFKGSNKYELNAGWVWVEAFNATLLQPDIAADVGHTSYFRIMYAPLVKVVDDNGLPIPNALINVKNVSGYQYYSGITTNAQGKTKQLPLNKSTWWGDYWEGKFTEITENPYTITAQKGALTASKTVNVKESNEIVIVLSQTPILLAPANNTDFTFQDLPLSWKPATGTTPTKYWLDAWVNGQHSSLLPIGGADVGLNTTFPLKSKDIEVAMQDGKWEWAVAAEIVGTKYWSEKWVINKKTGATLIAPANGKIVQVNEIFTWQAVSEAKNYVLKLDGFLPTSYYFPLNSQLPVFILVQAYYDALPSGKTYTWAIAGTGLNNTLSDTDTRLKTLSYGSSRTFKKG